VTESALISVVVPVYLNAETLRELYARVRDSLEEHGYPYEMIFVDDASPDSSRSILQSIAHSDRRVVILPLEKNAGQHQATLVGLAHSTGEWAVIMDADLQDSPEAIPHLIAKGQEGYAVVFAGRQGRYESEFRMITSRVFKRTIHWLCGVPKDAGMFAALNRRLIDRLLMMSGPSPSVPAMIGCIGFPMISIHVERARRMCGKSAYNFLLRLKHAWRSLAWVVMWKLRKIE
jgi:polyisoprenyl-phosphate glycosyltransferase